MRSPAARLNGLGDEQPARACLDRDMYLAAGERPHPVPDRLGLRRDSPAEDLAAGRVQTVEGDLTHMDVKARDDRSGQPCRHHASRLPSDRPLTVAHGRYLLFVMAGRAAGTRASLHNAVRHGGPATFTLWPTPPS
jgi:hypothetical protein